MNDDQHIDAGNHLDLPPITDHELVALIHGELQPGAAQELRWRLRGDATGAARLAALTAADRALTEALETPIRTGAASSPRWWRTAVAVAAAVVVAAVFVLRGLESRDEAAQNEFFTLRAGVVGAKQQPLLSGIELQLDWQIRGDGSRWKYVHVMPYAAGQDPAERGVAFDGCRPLLPEAGVVIPVVVHARIDAPDGRQLLARLDTGTTLLGTVSMPVPTHLFQLQTGEPAIYCGGQPVRGGWQEDFEWRLRHAPMAGPAIWLVDAPGTWKVTLVVECLPPPTKDQWPTFDTPLEVHTEFEATGLVSAWGEVHDGMQARMLLATGASAPERAPLALQLRNTGSRARRYNVTGSTRAAIPQPFHFDLLVDGVRWQQREDLGVLTGEDDLMRLHPAGTTRTLIVCPDYWQHEGRRFGSLLQGQLQIRFHFEPSLWSGDATELWRGELRTGSVELPPAALR